MFKTGKSLFLAKGLTTPTDCPRVRERVSKPGMGVDLNNVI